MREIAEKRAERLKEAEQRRINRMKKAEQQKKAEEEMQKLEEERAKQEEEAKKRIKEEEDSYDNQSQSFSQDESIEGIGATSPPPSVLENNKRKQVSFDEDTFNRSNISFDKSGIDSFTKIEEQIENQNSSQQGGNAFGDEGTEGNARIIHDQMFDKDSNSQSPGKDASSEESAFSAEEESNIQKIIPVKEEGINENESSSSFGELRSDGSSALDLFCNTENVEEFASGEGLKDSVARFGEPHQNILEKPTPTIRRGPVVAFQPTPTIKRDDSGLQKVAHFADSDIRNGTDGEQFDASFGISTGSGPNEAPRSILKKGKSGLSCTQKRISFAKPDSHSSSDDLSSPSVQSGPEFERIVINMDEEEEEEICECEMLPDYGKISDAFAIWKRRFAQRNPHSQSRLFIQSQSNDPASILREIQTMSTSIVIGEKRKRKPAVMEQSSLIRDLTEKHELLRKIEIQKDLNAALRNRYEQISTEVRIKTQPKPIPQSPAFRKIPQPSQNDRPLLSALHFSKTRGAEYQSSRSKTQTTQHTKIGSSGRITHMDILRLQYGE